MWKVYLNSGGQAHRSHSSEFQTCSQSPQNNEGPLPSSLTLQAPPSVPQWSTPPRGQKSEKDTDAFHTGQPPRVLRNGERWIEGNPAQRASKMNRLVPSALGEWIHLQKSYKHLIMGCCGCRIRDSFNLPQIIGSSLSENPEKTRSSSLRKS